jgi:N-acylneuraminate cytidylyltransferase
MAGAQGKPSIAALIPARAGSKRLKAKNVMPLGGHPLIAYTIAAARQSGIFDAVIVSTDMPEIAEVAVRYGAESPFLRPAEMAGDKSPDIEWLQYTLGRLRDGGRPFDAFALLRPTSPFRLPETIRRAWDQFRRVPGAESLRAVELCKQHPAKMWTVEGDYMKPFLDDGGRNPPWHSSAYQSLPVIHAQNASLEIAWSKVVLEGGTIAGKVITPFITEGYEGFDINRAEDFILAEALVARGEAALPRI